MNSDIEFNYSLSSSIFSSYEKIILNDIKKSKYSETCKALYRLQEKIDSIAQSINLLSNNNNSHYFIKASYRILIEHFLVGHFLWTKARITKNDTCGGEYYKEYLISEFFKRENYEIKIEAVKQNKVVNNQMSTLFKKYPELKDLKQSDIDEIHRTASKFDISSIFKYLINQVQDDWFKEFHVLMLSAWNEYNYLSSFVHCGPSAEIEFFENNDVAKNSLEIESYLLTSKIYSRAIKEDIMFLLLEEYPKYIDILKPIMQFKKLVLPQNKTTD